MSSVLILRDFSKMHSYYYIKTLIKCAEIAQIFKLGVLFIACKKKVKGLFFCVSGHSNWYFIVKKRKMFSLTAARKKLCQKKAML